MRWAVLLGDRVLLRILRLILLGLLPEILLWVILGI